jgi:hypothetical protein
MVRAGLILCLSALSLSCAGEDDLHHCTPLSEECNARDDDCDDQIDEGEGGGPLRRACSSVCGQGLEECSNGLWIFCSAPQPSSEICNGFDDDCDGQVDEDVGCECTHGDTRRCGIDTGVCEFGVEHCQHGTWGDCVLPYDPDALVELCNDGLDNDCDGDTDEECDCTPGDTQPCGTDDGECELGTMSCLDDSTWDDECIGAVGASDEVCNGLDDNCDGEIDFITSTDFGWSSDEQESNNTCGEGSPIYNSEGRAELLEGAGWLSISVDEPTNLQSYPTLYPMGDEDWYYLRAIEGGRTCVPWTSQCTFVARFQLRLLDIDAVSWADQRHEDYRLCVVAGTCSDAMNPDHKVCTHESSWSPSDDSYFLNVAWIGSCGSDDSRDLHIQVHSPTGAACGYYQLSVNFSYDTTIACP